jgi:hypothetical protein
LEHAQSSEAILMTALDLDKAIENRNIEAVLSKFSVDCEIELPKNFISIRICLKRPTDDISMDEND